MREFEKRLSYIASKCEYLYSGMGAVGYLYDSVKDNLRWANLRVKSYAWLLMRVGNIMVLDEKQYNKQKVKNTKMSNKSIENILLSAFGDGK